LAIIASALKFSSNPPQSPPVIIKNFNFVAFFIQNNQKKSENVDENENEVTMERL